MTGICFTALCAQRNGKLKLKMRRPASLSGQFSLSSADDEDDVLVGGTYDSMEAKVSIRIRDGASTGGFTIEAKEFKTRLA